MIHVPAAIKLASHALPLVMDRNADGTYSYTGGVAGLGFDFAGFANNASGSGGGFSWVDLIGAGAKGATEIIRATRQPYIVPGTANVVYDPQTGAMTTPVGTTAKDLGVGLAPIALIAAVAVVVLVVVMKK